MTFDSLFHGIKQHANQFSAQCKITSKGFAKAKNRSGCGFRSESSKGPGRRTLHQSISVGQFLGAITTKTAVLSWPERYVCKEVAKKC